MHHRHRTVLTARQLEVRMAPTVTPVGSELQVNSYTTGAQVVPEVAIDADGDFVVVWNGTGAVDTAGVFARRFNAAGVPQGGEFHVNTTSTGIEQESAAAISASGQFVVTWYAENGVAAINDVFFKLYDAAGSLLVGETRANTTTTGTQRQPAVAMDDDSDFVIVWQDSTDIRGQRFNAAGAPQGTEISVNAYTTNSQVFPTVAMDSDGDFVVAWQGNRLGGSGVSARLFAANGTPLTGDFPVDTSLNGATDPDVDRDADGDFVVAWSILALDGNGYGIFAQRFNALASPQGTNFGVNSITTNTQRFPSVSLDAAGEFIITWESSHVPAVNQDVYGRYFSPGGMPESPEFRVNTYQTIQQFQSSVAMMPNGNFVAAWNSQGQDKSGYGIYAQRYTHALPAAKVQAVQENDGTAQRSRVTGLTVTFDQTVTLPVNPADAFQLKRSSDNASVNLNATFNGASVTLSFTGGPVEFGSLADGRYTLTVLAAQVNSGGFDGNGDGTPGDDYVLIGAPANGLFRLFGDADGDGDTDATDFAAFRLAYGGANSTFDFDNDGDVDTGDFGQFRLRFGTVV